jgi:hypothetical protein
MHTIICIVKCYCFVEITLNFGHFAAVEEFALQNFPQTRAKSDGFKAAVCTARLAPNFHHKHVQPPLARCCNALMHAAHS